MLDIKLYKKDTISDFQNIHADTVKDAVVNIFKSVKENKDEAIKQYTEKFDVPKMPVDFQLIVSETEKKEAYKKVSKSFMKALDVVIENITEFHSYQLPTSWMKESTHGYYFGMQYHPIDIAGLYVPGGKALYPSSVCMNAIPAKIAGVSKLVMTTPPQKNGFIAPELIVAAQECAQVRI